MINEETLVVNRIKDLAEKSYQQSIYTHSGFLTLAEQSLIYDIERELAYADFSFDGGIEGAERVIARFGSADSFGYEEEHPLVVISVKPLLKKFADDLSHRDFLGALLNLGIDRNVLGDFIVSDKEADIIALRTVAEFICQELTRVRHTNVKCQVIELSDYIKNLPERTFQEITELVASERVDLIISKVCKISRSETVELFRDKKVTLNGRVFENNSGVFKAGDIFSVRGYGKYIYDGVNYTSKKGKLNVSLRKYV